MLRYFAGFILTVGLIVLVVVLLFGGGHKSKTAVPKPLWSYSNTDAETKLTIDGPINAQSEHEAIRVTVTRDNVTYEQIKGYQGDVANQQVFPNDESAYDAFLHGLYHTGFTKGKNDPKLSDEKGYCPLGNRYVFQLRQDGNDIERFWSTNCNGPKTYEGNTATTLELFKRQVPGFNDLVENLNLNL